MRSSRAATPSAPSPSTAASRTRFPTHLPALLRLVDITVDAGLEQETADAQARLADAHLAAGRAAEARVIAEDLLARYPTDPQHEDRLRRTLVALGEPHVEAVIAERLNTGNVLGFEDFPHAPRRHPCRDDATAEPRRGLPGGCAGSAEAESGGVERGGGAGDGARPVPAHRVVQGLSRRHHAPVARRGRGAALQAGAGVRRVRDAGPGDEGTAASPSAPRGGDSKPAAMLARLSLARGRVDEAIEWFERAAEAPAPSLDACRRLLYDLGDTLDSAGEQARALAVFLELQAESGTYRDVARRVERLRRAGGPAEADLLRRLLFAAYFFEVGLLLVIVPWSTFWDQNALLEAIPAVYRWTRSEFVRGAVSGLGALNIGAGLMELAAAWGARRGGDQGRALRPDMGGAPQGRS